MKKVTLTLLALLLIISSCNKERNPKNFSSSDTLIVDLTPNRKVIIQQFFDGDSLNIKTAKVDYYYNDIILKERYNGFMTSEYDGYADGEYQYYYNQKEKLLLEYYIESASGDTVKRIYRYSNDYRICTIWEYDLRKRLKSDRLHGDILDSSDFTQNRLWLFNEKWTKSFDSNS